MSLISEKNPSWASCVISSNLTIREAMIAMDESGKKILLLVDDQNLVGVVTDGDFRRYILRNGNFSAPIHQIATLNPKVTVDDESSKFNASEIMREYNLDVVPVIHRDGKLIDVIFWKDLFEDEAPRRTKISAKVIIMAGGKGTRLDPLTRILPKPLIPIGDKPIIEHIIESFSEYGCGDFIISVNFKSALIKAFFSEAGLQGDISFIEETMPMGTAGALGMLKGKMTQPFYVTNCDVLLKSNFSEGMREHTDRNAVITIFAALKHFAIPYGVIRATDTGEFSSIDEKPSLDFLINTGVYILSPSALDLLEPDKSCHMTDLISRVKTNGGLINVYPVSESAWMDMGQIAELKNMIEQFNG